MAKTTDIRLPPGWRQAERVIDPLLRRVYAQRRCFICGAAGVCGHREPALDRAAWGLPEVNPMTRCRICGGRAAAPGEGFWVNELWSGPTGRYVWICSVTCYEKLLARQRAQRAAARRAS